MIRITELRLPIEHAPEELEAAILKRLGISSKDLVDFIVFKRSYDARKNIALAFIYTIDVSVKNEEAILTKFGHDQHVRRCRSCGCFSWNAKVVSTDVLNTKKAPPKGSASLLLLTD